EALVGAEEVRSLEAAAGNLVSHKDLGDLVNVGAAGESVGDTSGDSDVVRRVVVAKVQNG
ncbi:hypothetical protein HDU96_004034, partial [Phlyctochytrium bullatum]